MRILLRLLIVTCLFAATSLQAITYIVPTDRDLVKRAEAIVIATALESHSEMRPNGGVVTLASFAVERVVKGSIGDHVNIVEPGGSVGDVSVSIPGSPRFESGRRYLVFLIHNNQGDWATYGFALGRFAFVQDLHGRTVVTRGEVREGLFGFDEGSWAPHLERLRGGPEFLKFVDTVLTSDSAVARTDYFVDRSLVIFDSFPEFGPRATAFVPRPLATRPDYLFSGNYRWNGPTVTFDYCCVSKGLQPGLDGPGAVSAGTGTWTGAGANIHYSVGINNESATGGLPSLGRGASDSINAVLFNDPFNDYAASNVPAGVVGIGGISKAGSPNYSLGDGTPGGYIPTLEGDVVIAKAATLAGISQATFNLVMTHELGHTLGFRHSDQTAADDPNAPCTAPLPCAGVGQAVMASTISSALTGLQRWDLDAAQTVYGSGPVCTPPSIGTSPTGTTINAGQSTTLSVGATGTGLTYQWYIGNSGTTTTPVPNGTSNQLTVSPSVTTSYWVRVSGQCAPPADSRTATVTVTQPTCTPPSVAAPSAVPSSISSGQSSTLTANAAGTAPFTYQWYVGVSGNTANPISGQTNSSVTVSPTATTSYWVRVTGQCAPAADSAATTVTVAACVPPAAPAPAASPSSISSGQSSTLSVSPTGTGPFTYQWFVGASGDQSNPLAGATSFSTSVSPAVTTSYWVKVTGQCAPPSNSPATTVTVVCTPITLGGVTAQPSTINVGQSSTIFVTTSGNGPFTFQWFRGSVGDASNPIAGAAGNSTVVSPTTSTSYWVHVTAPCGSQDGGVTVFVNAPCTQSSITTHPSSATIAPGGSTTLTVVAAGTAPISYQWYTGTSGNTASPIAGATNASVTVSPSATTTYWVHVANNCNTIGNNSTTAVVTVSASCPAPVITTQPASVSAGLGTAATFKVVATAPGTVIHYQWYKGATGDVSTKVGTDSDTFTTGAVSIPASYWVRLTSACSSSSTTDSNAAIVTPVAAPRGRAVKFSRDQLRKRESKAGEE
jgi:hypothetical protein